MTLTFGGPDYLEIATAIGLVRLREAYPELTGAGVVIGQVETPSSTAAGRDGLDFEVDPEAVGHPADNADGFLTYHRGPARSARFNDGAVGTYSQHASLIGSFIYDRTLYRGVPAGIAPEVARVDNYHFAEFAKTLLAGYPAKVVNLSYYDMAVPDALFDAAANRHNTVFVAAGNYGKPRPPSSAGNVICVSSAIKGQAIGPGSNGVPKPDLCAPQRSTSRAAAIVSGCAALLVQAGAGQAEAIDFRTIKALLLNGATRPHDYHTITHASYPSRPLDAIHGAGVVNIFNAVAQLRGGAHRPGLVAARRGWNLGTLAAGATDRYSFDLEAGQRLLATLTWAARDDGTIGRLRLGLAGGAGGGAESGNVQQVEITPARPGRHHLDIDAVCPQTETYALAFVVDA